MVVRWLKKFKHLWKVEIKEPPTFDELESQAEKNLEEDYQEKKNTEIENVFSTLESEETLIETDEIHSAPDYDVGEVEIDVDLNTDCRFDLDLIAIVVVVVVLFL